MAAKHYDIPWDPDLATGIHWIDEQHKQLLIHIEQLVNAISVQMSRQEVNNTLQFLRQYAHGHFGTEESIMRKYEYTGHDAQHYQHLQFFKRLEKMETEFEEYGPSEELGGRIGKFMWEWYKGHIRQHDMLFGQFLKDRKILSSDG